MSLRFKVQVLPLKIQTYYAPIIPIYTLCQNEAYYSKRICCLIVSCLSSTQEEHFTIKDPSKALK